MHRNNFWLKNSALFRFYGKFKLNYETQYFDRYRARYHKLSFDDKKELTKKWLIKYPEQAHFNYLPINTWLKEILPVTGRIIEIGGWRGDMAHRALSEFEEIECWHNYDLIPNNLSQKCSDSRYRLITLDNYIWNIPVSTYYNALIATHMIEHLNWDELTKLIKWIPDSISTVLFEAPVPEDAENYSWYGDHSSHVLEKGWLQICEEMQKVGFTVNCSQADTYIFVR